MRLTILCLIFDSLKQFYYIKQHKHNDNYAPKLYTNLIQNQNQKYFNDPWGEYWVKDRGTLLRCAESKWPCSSVPSGAHGFMSDGRTPASVEAHESKYSAKVIHRSERTAPVCLLGRLQRPCIKCTSTNDNNTARPSCVSLN